MGGDRERERERMKETKRLIDLFHPFVHSLVDSCRCPTRDQTHSPGALGRHSNQLRLNEFGWYWCLVFAASCFQSLLFYFP